MSPILASPIGLFKYRVEYYAENVFKGSGPGEIYFFTKNLPVVMQWLKRKLPFNEVLSVAGCISVVAVDSLLIQLQLQFHLFKTRHFSSGKE